MCVRALARGRIREVSPDGGLLFGPGQRKSLSLSLARVRVKYAPLGGKRGVRVPSGISQAGAACTSAIRGPIFDLLSANALITPVGERRG